MLYYLSLGSNDGDRELHLQNALNFLSECCDSLYSSTHYASPALGNGEEAKPYYQNAVALVDFGGDAPTLEALLKQFEIIEGRDSLARAEGRVPLDIDIVMAGDNILRPKDFSQYFFRRGYEELHSSLNIK